MENSSTVKNQGLKSYHIYFEDKCLFKNLDQEEFDLIWARIYRSYHKDSLSFYVCIVDECIREDQSY